MLAQGDEIAAVAYIGLWQHAVRGIEHITRSIDQPQADDFGKMARRQGQLLLYGSCILWSGGQRQGRQRCALGQFFQVGLGTPQGGLQPGLQHGHHIAGIHFGLVLFFDIGRAQQKRDQRCRAHEQQQEKHQVNALRTLDHGPRKDR